MHAKIELHREVHLDMFRPYAVIYEWIKGIDASEAQGEEMLDKEAMESLTLRSRHELAAKGFTVSDSKPHHLIVRPKPAGHLARDRTDSIIYGLVDFELLARTPDREAIARKTKRLSYLERQRDRFIPKDPGTFPAHLEQTSVLGVPYVCGRAETTGGLLWVAGKDPELFDYFLPERWEKTPRTKLSLVHEIYHTLTKDNINLVWQVSRVGIRPDADPFQEDERKALEYGYNSPFEEVSLAIHLADSGIPSTYPRAIYAVRNEEGGAGHLADRRRFETHTRFLTSEGDPILREDHDYIMVWGYWNGPDEKLAAEDGDYYEAIDALRAFNEGVVSQDEYIALMERMKARLLEVGVEDLNLRGNHLLLSLDSAGSLVKDDQGMPDVRICNFELLRRIE